MEIGLNPNAQAVPHNYKLLRASQTKIHTSQMLWQTCEESSNRVTFPPRTCLPLRKAHEEAAEGKMERVENSGNQETVENSGVYCDTDNTEGDRHWVYIHPCF